VITVPVSQDAPEDPVSLVRSALEDFEREFTVWTWLLRHHAASRLAIFGFVAPVVGVAVSVVALGEPLTPGLLASASLVAVGIVLANMQ